MSTNELQNSDSPCPAGFTRKESYKELKKNYHNEKKKATKELLDTLKDPTIVVLADYLKVRGTLKSWTKLWCVLKPGILLIYKSPKVKSNHWIGTVLLSTCKLIERPSKKDGFCFKLYHPLDQSIWALKGPEGETLGAVVQPLPTSHLIFRAPSISAGKCWMDALELSVKCSSILITTMSEDKSINLDESDIENTVTGLVWNESDVERHFKDQDLDEASHSEVDGINDAESLSTTAGPGDIPSETESEKDEGEGSADEVVETVYMEQEEGFLGVAGEQTEELADENKSFIWFLLKQLRPGMDLSKVVLPTFILEPRSFLDKLSDYYYHADIIGRAATENDPFTRMKTVVQWYLSGFYKKPKGLKKPYNPILGETFRCYWKHTNGSRTYYIAEQVSHHPPISALYVTNRQEGFTMSTAICTKSKYHGNSLSALLDGEARLTLLNRGEDYFITMPYAYCKGIFLGALSMELGGDVTLRCDKTGYSADLTFKLTPLFGKADQTNCISGKIKLGKETLATVEGHWDSVINLVDKKTGESQVLWHPTPEARKKRLKRFVVPIENQEEYESDRLWQHVAAAIKSEDQVKATEEKTKLEDVQRNEAKKRKESGSTWSAKFFEQDPETEQWFYKHSDVRPWDPRNDLYQYEKEFVICTRTKHRTPVVRSGSSSVVDRTGSTRQLKVPVQNEGLGHESIITSSKIPVMNGNLKEQLDVLRDDLMRMEGTIKSNESTLKQLVRTLDTKRERPSSRSELLLLILVVGIAQAFMMWSLLSKLQ